MSYSTTATFIRRPALWVSAVFVIAFLSLYIPLTHQVLQVTNQSTAVAAAPIAAKQAATPTRTPATATAPAKPPAATAAAAATPAPQACAPLAFGTPSLVSLSAASSGLHTQVDNPTYYQIYGYNAAQLRSQIQTCAPGANGSASAEFTAETSYSLAWSYDYSDDAGSCTLSNVKVGLHVAMALPSWSAQTSAAAGLSGRWQAFANGLYTHESGHVSLDTQYANQLVTDLQNLGTTDCSSLTAAVQSVVNHDVSALNSANDNYDARTNHGATQGAVLPAY